MVYKYLCVITVCLTLTSCNYVSSNIEESQEELINGDTELNEEKKLDLPENLYGEWELTDKIYAYNVGKGSPDVTGVIISISEEAVIYNNEEIENAYLYKIEDVDYYSLILDRYMPEKLGINKDDRGIIVYIHSGDDYRIVSILCINEEMFYLGNSECIYRMNKCD